jgi:hypothetical protein
MLEGRDMQLQARGRARKSVNMHMRLVAETRYDVHELLLTDRIRCGFTAVCYRFFNW